MATDIYMPALSPTMTEGVLTKWLVKVGDKVSAGDVLAEIETDKATMEVEAVDEGIISKLLVEEGASSVLVNSVIAILNGEAEDKNKKKTNKEDLKLFNKPKKDNEYLENITNNNNLQKDTLITKKNFKKISPNSKKITASPYVKYFANKEEISLENISGSGPNGRIIKRDLENKNSSSVLKSINNDKGILPSSMRKIIAERTTSTKQNVPHFYLTIESNVDKLLEMRKKINQNSNIKISINDIFVKALALAQKLNPSTNVSWIDGKIIKYDSIDVSIAVALDEGLITPIVKNADQKGLKEISNEIKELATKAKKGKLLPDEYNGGTISISNLGMFGITEFSAIINPPQSSILAVGTIKKIPGVINDEIKIINILKSTLSADHRVLDGAVAGKLLKDFNDIIENPFDLWILSDDMEII